MCRNKLTKTGCGVRRMFTSIKSLIFGEDLAADPVGKALGVVLRTVSHGSITIDVAQLTQYTTLAFIAAISAMSLRGFLRNLRKVTIWELRMLACTANALTPC